MNENIGDRFQHTRRNDRHSMAHHLKMYKDNVVVYGVAIEDVHVNFPPDTPQDYYNFICAPWWDPGNPPYLWGQDLNPGQIWAIRLTSGDPPDGDLVFKIRIDASKLPPDFWTSGFVFGDGENTAEQVHNKLMDSGGEMEVELIMYGRSAFCDQAKEGGDPGEALLPGWADPASSVLLDGQPIDGQVTWGPRTDLKSWKVDTILRKSVLSGTLVRVTGFLALDCHGDFWHPTGDCSEDDASKHNVEIHPAYAVDIGTDPCRSEADRLQALENELGRLTALMPQIPFSREAGERVGEDTQEQRIERARRIADEIKAWHAQHDAEVQQLRDRLASPACDIQWPTQPNTTPRFALAPRRPDTA
jgi:hypothetical protein